MNNIIQKEVVRVNSIDYLFIYAPSNAPTELLNSFLEAFRGTELSGRVIIIPSLINE